MNKRRDHHPIRAYCVECKRVHSGGCPKQQPDAIDHLVEKVVDAAFEEGAKVALEGIKAASKGLINLFRGKPGSDGSGS